MERLTQLRNRYLDLTNRVLPDLAQQRRFPVRFNHCFQRIVLDNLFNGCWYDMLNRRESAYRQLTEQQLEGAIALAEAMVNQPDDYLEQLNQNSLRWRRKPTRED